jgi:transcriptional regulator MraZ
MAGAHDFLQGEFCRTLDERFRLSIPQELADALANHGPDFVLVKERAGCLSLWPATAWRQRMETSVELLQAKLRAGKLDSRLTEIQSLGRLLSTRHKEVQLAGRGRLLIAEGFREFLQVPAGGDAMVIGAAVCIEIWNPAAWRTHLESQLPAFQQMFDQLAN